MSKYLDKVFNLVSLLAVSMLIVPLAATLLGSTAQGGGKTIILLVVLACTIGYACQALYAKLTGKKASTDGFDSRRDGVLNRFSFINAAVPILVCAVIAVGSFFLFEAYLTSLWKQGILIYYDVVYPLIYAIILFVCNIAGICIWFYPLERLADLRVILGSVVLYLIETFFLILNSAVLKENIDLGPVLGVPVGIFISCLLIILSQSVMTTKYRGSVVSVITPSARFYNLFLVIILVLAFLLVSVFTYVCVAGITILIKSLIYVALFRTFYGASNEYGYNAYDYEYVDSEEAGRMFTRDVMTPENQYIIAVFLMFLLLSVALFALAKSGILRKILRGIREWIRMIIYTILLGTDIMKHADMDIGFDPFFNYKDEKKSLQNAAIRDYDAMAEDTDTYRYFMSRLGRLKTFDEQLCYAYSVLLKMYKKINIALKSSDTPREVKGKVIKSIPSDEITQITADFEKIRYGEEVPDDFEASQVLNRICNVIKRYMF